MRLKAVSLNDLDKDKCRINIALLGNVSAGKSTFLNALLMDKYGEVSMNRCTASVCYFHFSPVTTKEKNAKKSADEIHEEISASNKVFRKKAKIREKHFVIEGQEHFVSINEELSPEINIVDIPGLNENSTSSMYKNYVRNKFHTFSMVIIVMDATQGVNTTEQVDLLKFVKKCSEETRTIPIMVLMNKVDPDEKCNEELRVMIKEIKHEVKKNIFRSDKKIRCIPISAEYSYIYRSVSKLSEEEFTSSFDKDLNVMNKIGIGEFGRKWNKMSKSNKIKAIHDIVKNKQEYQERLQECNFHLVLDVLEDFIGKKEQLSVIYDQVQFVLQNITVKKENGNRSALVEANFYNQMIECIKNTKALGMFNAECAAEYQRRFWDLWNELKELALHQFKIDPENRESLFICGNILEKYGTEMLLEFHVMSGSENKTKELQKVKDKFKNLIISKNEIIWANAVYHEYGFKYKNGTSEVFCSNGKHHDEAFWYKLSPGDWHFLLISSSLMSYDRTFTCELASSIAQMRYHELQFSKISEGCFHSVEAEGNFFTIEFETVKLCSSYVTKHDWLGNSFTIPKSIPQAVMSSSCVKCNEKTLLNGFGFCIKCYYCVSCGNKCTHTGSSCGYFSSYGCNSSNSAHYSYCASCRLCNNCGCYKNIHGSYFRLCTTDMNEMYKNLGKTISIETLKKTSWFKQPSTHEPMEKKFKNTYPKSATCTSPKDKSHWGHLEYIFTTLMNSKVYITV